MLWYSQVYNTLLLKFNLVNNFNKFYLNNNLNTNFSRNFNTMLSHNTQLPKPLLNRTFLNQKFLAQKNHCKITLSSAKFFKPLHKIQLFNILLKFSCNNTNQFYTPHVNFKTMFIGIIDSKTSMINTSKLFSKWVNTYNLITNIFINKLNIFLFSNKVFKNEILTFNWSVCLLDYSLFKFSSPYFFLKDSSFSVSSEVVFQRFEKQGLNLVFILDLKHHEKSLHFLKKTSIFVISLTPFNMNPWLVSYSIPVSSNNIFIQYFFIKVLLVLRQYSEINLFYYLKGSLNKLN